MLRQRLKVNKCVLFDSLKYRQPTNGQSSQIEACPAARSHWSVRNRNWNELLLVVVDPVWMWSSHVVAAQLLSTQGQRCREASIWALQGSLPSLYSVYVQQCGHHYASDILYYRRSLHLPGYWNLRIRETQDRQTASIHRAQRERRVSSPHVGNDSREYKFLRSTGL